MINFNRIPNNIRNPLFYAEVSNAKAGTFQADFRVMLVGQSVNTITEEPVLVSSVDWAKTTFGVGAQITRMVDTFRRNNTFQELWVLPLNDAAGSDAAEGTITITGTATASGTLNLYVAGEKVAAGVISGDTATVAATNLAAAINAQSDLPVSATAAAGVVTITAKNKGTLGNKISLKFNFGGVLANETTPAGLSVVVAAMTDGATDPNLANKLSLIGDLDVAYFGHPYADTTSLDDWRDYLYERWNPLVAKYGQAFTATNDTLANLQTLGLSRNDEYHSIMGFEDTNPSWSVDVAAAYVGQASFSISNDPMQPLQTLPLIGVVMPKEKDRFTLSNRAVLLNSGIATLFYKAGAAAIERAITTYQKNGFGQSDNSYLDVGVLAANTFIIKAVGYKITQMYSRSKLAKDGTIVGAGSNVVTPKQIKGTLLNLYAEWEFMGIVQAAGDFEKELVVEINPTDHGRVDILLPPYLINGLYVVATKVEFRL